MSNKISTGSNSGCAHPFVLALLAGFFLLVSNGHFPDLRPIWRHLISSSSDWLVATKNGWSSSIMSTSCLSYLNTIKEQKQQIKQIAFTSRGGCFIIVTQPDQMYYDSADLPKPLVELLETIDIMQDGVRFIEFGIDTAWILIMENNDAYWNSIPTEMADKIRTLNKMSIPIKNIAFAPNGGWIILGDEEVSSVGIDQNVHDEILKLRNSEHSIKQVEFPQDRGWLIIVDQNLFISNNIPVDMLNHLNALKESGQEIVSVDFIQIKPD